VDNTVLRSPVWSKVKRFTLSMNMRAMTGTEEFRRWLLQVGVGMPTTLSNGLVSVTPTVSIPADMNVKNIEELEEFVFWRLCVFGR